jgi:hypothetical protein
MLALGLAGAASAMAPARAAIAGSQAGAAGGSPSPVPARGVEFLLGTWDILAATPGTDERIRFRYEVRPLLDNVWFSGHGRSGDGTMESRDVWGRDAQSGQLIRVIFDGSGTWATMRSPGWQGERLVLEGDARSAGGAVRVRETIERLGANEFVATWEAWRNGAWSADSIERVTRRAAAAGPS